MYFSNAQKAEFFTVTLKAMFHARSGRGTRVIRQFVGGCGHPCKGAEWARPDRKVRSGWVIPHGTGDNRATALTTIHDDCGGRSSR
ncbi:hypothetical protein OG21DRAFT_810760 [Imleria badia]|nr:hypothetical protein OG21DRAFT_810760 [Imleria badia]